MTFSEKLITLRAGRGWSQEKLAEALGVTRQAVGRWERGTSLPDALGLTGLARVFDVDAEWLVDDADAGAPKPRTARRAKLVWFDWVMIALVPISIAAYPLLSAWVQSVKGATYAVPAWYVWVAVPLGALRFISAGWSVAALVSALIVSIRPRRRALCTAVIAVGCVLMAAYLITGTALLATIPDPVADFTVLVVLPAMRRPYLLALLAFIVSAAVSRAEKTP